MNESKLNAAIESYVAKKQVNTAYYNERWSERTKRKSYYQSFTKQTLLAMTTDDFLEYISKLWSMLMWGNKKDHVDKLIADNGFDYLKRQLVELLYGSSAIESRWDNFLKNIKGLGPAAISELLTYVDPNKYVIINRRTVQCFCYLEIADMPKYNSQYTGKKYTEVCTTAHRIALAMQIAGETDVDLLTVDYFLWDEILPLAEKKTTAKNAPSFSSTITPSTSKEKNSLHDEIKEKIVVIGKLLGFESRAEVKITAGSVVDAVWEAKIGNMGKAIYVFEVQSKGSIDSLLVNLQKAKKNAAVQAVVVVSDEAQLSKILRHNDNLIDLSYLRTWDSEDVLAVHDALVRAHESINKLALVPDSFS